MLLTRSTREEIESYLKGSKAIVVPIGSTEQHGPLGLIGTDAFTAEAVAYGLGEKAGVLVGPTLALSVAQFNLGFPGTISLRATSLMAVIEDYVLSLKRQGFEHFYFVNGHGANISVAGAAFQDIYARWSLGTMQGKPPRCRLSSWWDYPQVDALRKQWYGDAEGMHATPSEIAVTLHLLPGSARQGAGLSPELLSSNYVRDHAGDNHWDAQTHRAAFPDGRVGSHSALATAEQGAQLLAAAVDGASDDFAAFVAEK
jgi:creatinine amidohydrolase